MSSAVTRDDKRVDWKQLTEFHAKTTHEEKVSRVANALVMGTALYGAYAYFTGSIGLVSGAALALAARKIVFIVIGYAAYPAAATTVLGYQKGYEESGNWEKQRLEREGYFVKKIPLYKSGTRYEAYLIGHASTINNGKWTIQGLGNNMTMEPYLSEYARGNFARKSNTLLINGPSVCGSGGWPTRYQMGAGFESGLQFLEQKVKATHIIMSGLSLGGSKKATWAPHSTNHHSSNKR